MFTIWFKRMFRQKVSIEEYDKITSLAEVKNMLTAVADEIMQKGIKKGIEKGELLDKQKVIIRLISKKFGITEKEEAAIKTVINGNILDKAIDAVLFAETKLEVFRILGI